MKFLTPQQRRKTQAVRLIVLLVALGLLVTAKSHFLGGTEDPLVEIKNEYFLPIEELSSLALINGVKNAPVPQFAAIGDAKARIGLFQIQKDHLQPLAEIDFSKPLQDKFSLCSSLSQGICEKLALALQTDWEGIAFSQGLFFALQEHSGAVVVVDKEGRDRSIINLNFEPVLNRKFNRKKSGKEDAKLGEGLLLLKNGHLLVTKENKPPSIIEFGPQGEMPLGFSADTVLPADQSFLLSKPNLARLQLEPLAEWVLPGKAKCDFSDLSFNHTDHPLLVVSQKCNKIFAISNFDAESRFLEIQKTWELPGKIKGAEAIVVFEDGILIGSDHKRNDKPNIFAVTLP